MASNATQTKEMSSWLLTIRPPDVIWENHPTSLLAEVFFYIAGLLTLSHALRHGGRYKYLWLAVLLVGAVMEGIWHVLPESPQFFWHAHSSVMLLGARLPLHAVFIYSSIIYVAIVTASKLRLGSTITEAFAAGGLAVILDFPLEIIGVKLLWWTWHDTDLVMMERHLNAPLVTYMFMALITSSLCMAFHGMRYVLARNLQKFESAGFILEIIVCILSPLLALVLWMGQNYVFYGVLHDSLHINTQTCLLVLLAIYLLVTWSCDRHPVVGARANKGNWLDEIGFLSFLQFSFYILLMSFARPEDIRSTGHHQPVGPCTDTTKMYNTLGKEITRNTNLCLEKYNEPFDFHCTKPPRGVATEYTICGQPFDDYQDYLVAITLACCMGFYVFWQILGHSGFYPKIDHKPAPHYHHHKSKTN